MAYYTESEIRRLGSSPKNIREAKRLEKALGDTNPQVFLSHSHHDKDLVQYAKVMLEGMGVSVYIDWEDTTMPSVTSAPTAWLLKNYIRKHNKFIMLASKRALASLWVPWELGFADGVKGLNNIAILPATDDTGNWPGNEYVQVYHKIKVGVTQDDPEEGPAVFAPGASEGTWLYQWVCE